MPIIKNKRTNAEHSVTSEALEEMKAKKLLKRFTVVSDATPSDYTPPEVQEIRDLKPKPKAKASEKDNKKE